MGILIAILAYTYGAVPVNSPYIRFCVQWGNAPASMDQQVKCYPSVFGDQTCDFTHFIPAPSTKAKTCTKEIVIVKALDQHILKLFKFIPQQTYAVIKHTAVLKELYHFLGENSLSPPPRF
ncbi:hypothetical protein PEPS_01800 [Persicobacter psychrovividus]|uniref:Uncharacterized protein n=1 Tax=Persicobacter psychrovividus TaxID=387638 RepID=A0ABN6L4B5_9BACT|nr:hypothetical protein PEPS_01800 [Persicobacter psychrovividus]